MKRLFTLLLAAGLLISLSSCGSIGRTMGSVGRTFSNSSGQSAPVIR